jgi:hypothetical protein
MYVQNEEDELERKRTHCESFSFSSLARLTTADTNVVKAFESALNLLKANDIRLRG